VRPSLLFDLDGTLVHTDHLHFNAFVELFARDGRSIDECEFKARILGRPNDLIFADYYPHLAKPEQRALADGKEARVREMIAAGERLPPAPGLLRLLDWADAHQVPMAIVTNAPPANAAIMLQASGLAPRLTTIVSGDDLAHGKPHPLPYLEGLRLTGGAVGRTIAFEDSIAGLKSAVAANIPCVGMGSSLAGTGLRAAGAVLIAQDFNDPELLALIHRTLRVDQ
jgi:HAD superfamily hydrolase (TIGR01509 family)